jgi:crotonobetaine/carnitine-CoA ligase
VIRGSGPESGAPRALSGDDVSSRQTLWTLLERWSTARADEDLLVFLSDTARPKIAGTITWERFAQDAWDLRRRLAAVGVGDGRTLVLALPNTPLTLALWVAGQANGAAVHAVDPDAGVLTFARAVAIRPALVVSMAANAPVVAEAIHSAGAATPLVVVPEVSAWSTSPPLEGLQRSTTSVPSATAEMVAGLLPTSGTSGAPKLVQLTHRNYVMSGERLARNSGYLAGDRHYLCSPFFPHERPAVLVRTPIRHRRLDRDGAALQRDSLVRRGALDRGDRRLHGRAPYADGPA